MKHITKTLILAIGGLSALTACDNIKDEERFIEMPPVEAQRIVLLEEFTGQLCVNCPEAHETVKDLLTKYPDNLISVSMHGGGNANSIGEDNPNLYGLRTDESEAYCNDNKISAFPAGVVNRAYEVQTKDAWETSIRKQLEKNSTLDIELQANLSEDKKTIEVTTNIDPHANEAGFVQLWVVESGIVAIQRTPSGFNQDYVHDHVFRADVNGHGGEKVTLVTREPQILSHSIVVKERWNADNLSIIAFVYNSSGILQAAHCKVQ